MKTELKDYLHFYLGSNYIIKYKYKTHHTRKALPMLTNGSYYNVVSLLRSPQYYDVKLVLRRLNDITDEEVGECEDELWADFPQAMTSNKVEFLKMFIDSMPDYRPGFTIYVKAINWLRKHGFDCDGLIEAGLAIDKTTIK